MSHGQAVSAAVAERVLRSAHHSVNAGVIFIDGHSGAGKTTLARDLRDEFATRTGVTPQIVSMDELYPGWDGLAAGSASVAGVIADGAYQRYDWHAAAFAETRQLATDRLVIVEGCGSITPHAIAAAAARGWAYVLWLALPQATRKQRALARDGEMFAPHWDDWAAQEAALFARTQPLAAANEVIHPA